MNKIIFLIPLFLLTLLIVLSENKVKKPILDSAIKLKNVNDFIVEFSKEGIYTQKELESIFSNTYIMKKKITQSKNNQPEVKLTWKDYKKRMVTDIRINAGKLFLIKNRKVFKNIKKDFDIDPEIITAIIALESNFGLKGGGYKAIESLSTLAFEYYPKGSFYKKELKEFLIFTKKNNINPFSIKSSWAGAIGIPQFMPSSINHYAIDYNNDGEIDLINSYEDSIGSVANYLVKNKFKNDNFYFEKINVDYELSTGFKLDKNCKDFKVDSKYCNNNFKLFKLDDDIYIGGSIFNSITLYNRSNFYAAAVLEIARNLKN